MSRPPLALIAVLAASACGDDLATPAVVVVTMNTGTTPGLGHDGPPDDGYTSTHAAYSDEHYGDGLAWVAVIDATRAFFDEVAPDVVAFQEIFATEGCAAVPAEARPGFVCDGWSDGDPTVAERVLGPGFQIACHVGHHDKCVAVRRAFGTIRGCDGDVCLDGAVGFAVPGCGGGARVARVVIDRPNGAPITVAHVHGTSGFGDEDVACRVAQVEQVFVDLGDGAPAASGEANLVLGDLNTDPGRIADGDASAARWNDFVGDGAAFRFVTAVGPDAPPTYAGLFNIDHVITDVMPGTCWTAGVTAGRAPVTGAVYYDHAPAVCTLALPD